MPFAHFDGLKSLFRGAESRRGRRSIARRAAVVAASPRGAAGRSQTPHNFMMINDPLVTEGTGGTKEMSFTVSLAVTTGNTVTVDYQTADDSARAGLDYVATQGTLSFAPGAEEQDHLGVDRRRQCRRVVRVVLPEVVQPRECPRHQEPWASARSWTTTRRWRRTAGKSPHR